MLGAGMLGIIWYCSTIGNTLISRYACVARCRIMMVRRCLVRVLDRLLGRGSAVPGCVPSHVVLGRWLV
jgi:hypothetical protein